MPGPDAPSRLTPALVLAVGLASGACGERPETCAKALDEAAVREVLDAQREAWNRGDLDAFLAGYERSDALLFTSGGNIRRGYEETRTKYQARYGEARETMGTLAFEVLDVRGLGACHDTAIILGRWSLTETEQAGSGVFSLMLERQPEGWRIVHDHTSSDPDPGPGPAPAADPAADE